MFNILFKVARLLLLWLSTDARSGPTMSGNLAEKYNLVYFKRALQLQHETDILQIKIATN